MRTRAALSLIVAALFLSALVVPAQAELVGYWNFDSSDFSDSSGNGNNGAATHGSSITFETDTPLGSGLSGQNYATNAANVISVPTSPTLESIDDQMTIAFWMKEVNGNTPYGWDRLFQHGTEGQTSVPSWMINQYNGTARINIRVDTTGAWNQNIATGGAGTLDGAWHHMAFVLDNGAWRKYVDGVESTGSYTHGDGLSNTRYLNIFGRNNAGHYIGRLDDIGLWSDALDTAYARSTYTVPTDLGLDYDLDDMMDLWDTYEAAGGTNVSIDGIGWTYTDALPGSTGLGDAYKHADGNLYIVLGSGAGLVGVPEPSTVAMLLGLAAAGLLGYLRRRRK